MGVDFYFMAKQAREKLEKEKIEYIQICLTFANDNGDVDGYWVIESSDARDFRQKLDEFRGTDWLQLSDPIMLTSHPFEEVPEERLFLVVFIKYKENQNEKETGIED
jgi:hypothetical protein